MTNPRQRVQHRWQFQVGIACFAFPFLYLLAHYAGIFHSEMAEFNPAIGDPKIDSSRIENGINTAMNTSLWFLPVMLVGVIFIVVAIRRRQR